VYTKLYSVRQQFLSFSAISKSVTYLLNISYIWSSADYITKAWGRKQKLLRFFALVLGAG